ncbi:MAG: hypothetical protein R2857_05815 [Vampirovibrionales bacterium]
MNRSHAAAQNDARVNIHWVDTETCATLADAQAKLAGVDGVVVPGGFGNRGIEGKINVIQYAREHNLPFLGLCLGMQCAVIEFARHVAQLNGAHSGEFEDTAPHLVIDLMDHQKSISDLGGTMRLGQYPCHLTKGSLTEKLYAAEGHSDVVMERHRHRYEFNNDYRQMLIGRRADYSGTSPDRKLVEVVELPQHKYFIDASFIPSFYPVPASRIRCFRALSVRPWAAPDLRGRPAGDHQRSCQPRFVHKP